MTTLAVVLVFIIIIYINTIYISYWRSLSKTDQEKVIAERSRLVIQKGRGSAISSRSVSGRSNVTNYINLKHLQKQNKKCKSNIKALQKNKEDYDDQYIDGAK